jgi:hypothetical protein
VALLGELVGEHLEVVLSIYLFWDHLLLGSGDLLFLFLLFDVGEIKSLFRRLIIFRLFANEHLDGMGVVDFDGLLLGLLNFPLPFLFL